MGPTIRGIVSDSQVSTNRISKLHAFVATSHGSDVEFGVKSKSASGISSPRCLQAQSGCLRTPSEGHGRSGLVSMRADPIQFERPRTLFGRSVPARPWLLFLLVLATTGLGISIYLAYVALTGSKVVGCSGGNVFDCEHVFHSRWAKWWGLPVSLPAAGIYIGLVSLLGYSLFSRDESTWRHPAWGLATLGTAVAAAAGLWFIFLQVAVIGKLCMYCLGVHSIGLLLCATTVLLSPLRWQSAIGTGGLAVFGLAGLITGQLASTANPTFEVEWNTQVVAAQDASETMELSLEEESEIMEAPESLDSPEAAEQPMIAVVETPEAAIELSNAETLMETPMEASAPDEAETINVLAIDPPPAPTQTPVPAVDDANESQPARGSDSPANVEKAKAVKATGDTASETPVDRSLQLASINLKFQTRGRPVIGKVEAPVVFVELFDYTCQHCRKFNRQWQTVRQRYGDQVALMPLVVPLCLQCNSQVSSTAPGHEEACEIALIALAVWRLQPDQFAAFHDWLCEPEFTRSLADVRQHANQIVGGQELAKELSGKMISKHLAQHIELYRRLQKGTLPKLVSEQMTLTGVPESPESLCSQVEAVLVASRKK